MPEYADESAGTVVWRESCPLCHHRLASSWRPRPFSHWELLAQRYGGRGRISVAGRLDYDSSEGQPFRRRWVQRVRDLLRWLTIDEGTVVYASPSPVPLGLDRIYRCAPDSDIAPTRRLEL